MRSSDQWLTQNYGNIRQWAANICGKKDAEEVAHHVVEIFLNSPKRDQLVDDGIAQWWIVRTIMNQYRSSTSTFHKLWKEGGHSSELSPNLSEEPVDYPVERDLLELKASILLEECLESKDPATWYRAMLFKLWVETPNFLKLSRLTGIPRTSIAQAVKEFKEHLRNRLT